MKILVFGGKGFIGSQLIPMLRYKNYQVELFSRKPHPGERYWNPECNELNPNFLENSDIIINLAGENIFGIGTKAKLERIRKSRLSAAELITETIKNLSFPPSLYLGASAVGYYGNRDSEPLTETSPPGHSFFATLCDQLESISNKLKDINIRTINCRFGIVLGKEGGVLSKMIIPFQMGLGGTLGSGTQMVSWIAIEDLISAILFIIEQKKIQGPVNFTSPNPITNKQLTNALADKLNRPAFVNLPKWLLALLFGSTAHLFLESIAAYPKVLLDAGFIYQYPNIDSALNKIL